MISCAAAALCIFTADIRVIDGDTFAVGDERVRLWGIDAPERGEAGGAQATEALTRALRSADRIACVEQYRDRWGRMIARCVLLDGPHAPAELGCHIISRGPARDWPKYSGGAYRGC